MSIRRPKQVTYPRSLSPDSDAECWHRSPSPEAACQPNNYVEPFSWTRTRNERDIQIDKETMRQLVFEVAAQFKEEGEYFIQIDKETMRQIVFEVAAQFKEASESHKVPTYELNTKDGRLGEVD
ncbi:hypothetical protein GALMADRAFT_243737 [Galerina marginata CBS 339.88]|uniref:Uncharacterized protein n=1 Tax=Galerina marginata (strain CBS 339.88) TaxID=685588 RepID=A0A067TL17_GALM3|nr:hypothetical protein GALMADRAFT_243737 [Galerina marginata CBS 339.88]